MLISMCDILSVLDSSECLFVIHCKGHLLLLHQSIVVNTPRLRFIEVLFLLAYMFRVVDMFLCPPFYVVISREHQRSTVLCSASKKYWLHKRRTWRGGVEPRVLGSTTTNCCATHVHTEGVLLIILSSRNTCTYLGTVPLRTNERENLNKWKKNHTNPLYSIDALIENQTLLGTKKNWQGGCLPQTYLIGSTRAPREEPRYAWPGVDSLLLLSICYNQGSMIEISLPLMGS